MKKWSWMLSFMAVSLCGQAQITTPGTGVNWNLDSLVQYFPQSINGGNGVYLLSDSLEISSADTLEATFDSLYIGQNQLVGISGTLIMDLGNNRGVITSVDTALPYAGFRFEDGSYGFFQNIEFNGGGGIRVLTEVFEMHNCTVKKMTDIASTGAAISFSRGIPVVMNSIFLDNELPAFSSGANSEVAPVLKYNWLENNCTQNSNRPQINLGPSGQGDTTRIVGNTVIGNPNSTNVGGIAVSSLLSIQCAAIIDSNEVRYNRYGIALTGSNIYALVRYNEIDSNNTQGDPMLGGSGVNMNSAGGNNHAILSHNSITGNLWGITVIGQATINLGDTLSGSFNEGMNRFSNNQNNGQVYALYNNTSLNIQALNNCWETDTATGLTAEDVIFHQPDDNSLGLVSFDPVMPCFPQDTISVENFESITWNIYPNPAHKIFNIESPSSGDYKVFNLTGKCVLSGILEKGINQIELEIESGLYLVYFQNDKQQGYKRLIIQ